ncbi:hypothetical protein J7J23_00650 [bacterium]|nr:hypothetical protein [bacterium]
MKSQTQSIHKTKNIFWKDKYYFPQLVDILFSNLFLLFASILLFLFFVKRGFVVIGSLFEGIISGSLNSLSIVLELLLAVFLSIILLFVFWSFLVVVRTISYFLLSKSLAIYKDGLFLGRDKIIFPDKLDRFLFMSSENFFLRKTPFFRAILDYPFFKIKNKNSIYLGFDKIAQISITKELVFRSISSLGWWLPKDEAYYLKVITNDGNIYEKEIKDICDFVKNDCLNFLSSKIQSSIEAPSEIKNTKLLKFENLTSLIAAIITLILLIFFVLVYIKIYGGIDVIPFIR